MGNQFQMAMAVESRLSNSDLLLPEVSSGTSHSYERESSGARTRTRVSKDVICVSHRPAFWVSALKSRTGGRFAIWGDG